MKIDVRGRAAPLSTAPSVLRASPVELRTAAQLRRAPPYSMMMRDGTWQLRWTADPLVEPAVLMQFRIGGARAAVGLHSLVPFHEFASLVSSRAPAAMIAAWLDAKGSEVWNMIELITGCAVDVLAFEPFPTEKSKQGCRLGFELSHVTGQQRVRGTIYLQDKTALSLILGVPFALRKEPPPEGPLASAVDHSAIRLMATLGRTVLSKQELFGLVPGDTVLIDRVYEQAQGEMELSAGLLAAPFAYCRIENSKIRITRFAKHTGEADMLETETPEPDANYLNDKFDQMQVELRFEIGRWRTSFAELRQLTPGAVIELDQPVDGESVTVWVDRQRVGRGRVVAVGDQLGVQIVGRTEDGSPNPGTR